MGLLHLVSQAEENLLRPHAANGRLDAGL